MKYRKKSDEMSLHLLQGAFKIGAWFHRQEVEMEIYRIIIKVLNIFQVSDGIKVL